MDIKKRALEASEKYNIDNRVAELLLRRGIKEESMEAFLFPENEEISDPEKLDGITAAVSRIRQAIDTNQKIVIYGDYDADGITSTAILYKALRSVTKHVSYYIPERDAEGYGLNEKALAFLLFDKTDLVITVDCGIKSTELISRYRQQGMDFIVTDHHTPDKVLPDAIIVNPKLQSPPEFLELAGVGVAYLLAKGLFRHYEEIAKTDDQLLQLAAIGTIADLVILNMQNRIIIRKGIVKINQNPLPGIKTLLGICEQETVDTKTIAFLIAPILNSSGRMESPEKALRLLISDDLLELEGLSAELLDINEQRKKLVEGIYKEAKTMILENQFFMDPVIIAEKDEWRPGVLGIVASKLVNDYHRPVILLSASDDGLCKGSARSIPGYHLYGALEKQSEVLESFGGHAQAAGLSLKPEKVEVLRRNLNHDAYQIMGKTDFKKEIVADLDLDVTQDITMEFHRDLAYLEPFGNGNPEPLFSFSRPVSMNLTKIGKLKNHLRADIQTEAKKVKGVYFNYNEFKPDLFYSNLIFGIGINEWMNRRSIQLEIKKISEADNVTAQKREEQIYSEILINHDIPPKDFTFNQKMKYNEFYKLIQNRHSIIYSDDVSKLIEEYPVINDYQYHQFRISEAFPENFTALKNYLKNEQTSIIITDTMVMMPEIMAVTGNYFFHSFPDYQNLFRVIADKKPEIVIGLLADPQKNKPAFHRDLLGQIYRKLQNISLDQTAFFDINDFIKEINKEQGTAINDKQIVTALLIFRELDFLEYSMEGDLVVVTFNKEIKKTKLEESKLYQFISG